MTAKMKYDVFFENRGGEGPLSLYFAAGPYGNAVESSDGGGVGFFSETGTLLAVQFDRVISAMDHQRLGFQNGIWVEISMKQGKVKVIQAQPSPISQPAAPR